MNDKRHMIYIPGEVTDIQVGMLRWVPWQDGTMRLSLVEQIDGNRVLVKAVAYGKRDWVPLEAVQKSYVHPTA